MCFRTAGLLACAALFAQNGDVPTLRITVNLVQIDAVVTDKHGHHVTDLTKEDFRIFQDDNPQVITLFSYIGGTAPVSPARREVVVPTFTQPRREQIQRSVVLMVDDLGLSFTSMAAVREALGKFVDTEVQPGDAVAIIRTGRSMGALQQFTTDKRMLQAAIQRLRWNGLGRASIGAFDAVGSLATDERFSHEEVVSRALRERTYTMGTLDALAYVVRGLRDMPGRKSLILFSDGFHVVDPSPRGYDLAEPVRRFADLANRSGVVIYAIDARGLHPLTLGAEDNTTPGDATQTPLRNTPLLVAQSLAFRRNAFLANRQGPEILAGQTGGLFWSDNNDLAGAARAAMEDSNGYYLIGFNPGEAAFALGDAKSKYHHLRVTVKRRGLHVRSRNGYFGTPDQPAPPSPKGREQQLTAAIFSPFHSGDIRVHLTALFNNAADGGPNLDSLLHVNGGDLTFTEEADGWKKAVVDILQVTFGDNGAAADTSDRTFQVRLKAEAYERAVRWGFVYRVTQPLKKPGAYQFRVAVRDAASGKVGSASQFIEAPDISKGQLALSGVSLQGGASGSAANGGGSAEMEDPDSGPATRIFRRGHPVSYDFVAYNPELGRDRRKREVAIQVRVFHDGKQVWAGEPFSLASATSPDPVRLQVAQQMSFSPRTAPGEYLLQVTATDKLAKKNEAPVVQWMDFELK